MKSGFLVVANGTRDECPLWQHEGARIPPWAQAQSPGILPAVRGSCAEPEGQWKLDSVPDSEESASWLVRAVSNTSICLGLHSGEPGRVGAVVYGVPCQEAARFGKINVPGSDEFLLYISVPNATGKQQQMFQSVETGQSGSCLVSVAGNTNNTLSIALEVRDPTGHAMPLSVTGNDNKTTVIANVPITPGLQYTVVTAAITRRDTEAKSLRPSSSFVNSSDTNVLAVVGIQAKQANSSALCEEHTAWWKAFWNVSSIDLGPSRQLLEGWWYGMQYLLGSSSREGKVTPSLWGPWSIHDPPNWVDDITMDYNIEANFWGTSSSNHLELMEPYFATIYSLYDESKARASRPDWSIPGQIPIPSLGINTQGEECGDFAKNAAESKSGCPKGFGSFSGLAVPNGIGPFAFQRLFHDDSNRFGAALAATPLVQYFKYSRNVTFLEEGAYRWVKGVAEFYRSYVVWHNDTAKYEIPYACAEEGCVLRNLPKACPKPNQTKNTALDISLAKMALGAAAEWADLLGVDAALAKQWTAITSALPDYPITVDSFSQRTVFSSSVDMASNQSLCFGANFDEPMLTLAPLFPAEQIAARRHGAPPSAQELAVWSAANASVWELGEYQARSGNSGSWAPLNGFCMMWPPAARITAPSEASKLLDKFEGALNRTMANNFWPKLGGGGIEQAGAVAAINDMLLASFNGYLEFFPLWPVGHAAAFTTLRAEGAFICSCSVSAVGVVGHAEVLAEVGGKLDFVSPIKGKMPRVTVRGGGVGSDTALPVVSLPGDVWSVATERGVTYDIQW